MSMYNIILIGKTGVGKSTTGNKLLQADEYLDRITTWYGDIEIPRFGVSSVFNSKSCTQHPRFLKNPVTNVSILDTPGFGDSGEGSTSKSIEQINLGIFRKIVQYQMANSDQPFNRVLFFIPNRGALEKADAYIKNELRTIEFFFGSKVFGSMIIVSTRDPDDINAPLSEAMVTKTKMSFNTALSDLRYKVECPPVIFIGFHETGSEILKRIKKTPVINKDITLRFQECVCSRCACEIVFRDDKTKLIVICGMTMRYEESSCHPWFIPKYTKLEKLAGGVVKVATLGLINLVELIAEKTVMPGILNEEEKCTNCGKAPEADGCLKVETPYYGTTIQHRCEI